MISTEKRKKMETLIYNFFDAFDRTGKNTSFYRERFEKMTNKEFDDFFKDFFDNPKAYLVLNITDYENTMSLKDIKRASKVLNVPLFENVSMSHVTMDKNNIVCTSEPVPVGYIHIKRPQQTISKKNGVSTSIDTRGSLTNQVTGADKNGKESDLENTMLASIQLRNTLKELNGPRADDLHMKNQMLQQIAVNGYVNYTDLESIPENKTTLNTVDTFFIGMGIKTDLVTKGLMLPATLKNQI